MDKKKRKQYCVVINVDLTEQIIGSKSIQVRQAWGKCGLNVRTHNSWAAGESFMVTSFSLCLCENTKNKNKTPCCLNLIIFKSQPHIWLWHRTFVKTLSSWVHLDPQKADNSHLLTLLTSAPYRRRASNCGSVRFLWIAWWSSAF